MSARQIIKEQRQKIKNFGDTQAKDPTKHLDVGYLNLVKWNGNVPFPHPTCPIRIINTSSKAGLLTL